MTDSLFVLCLGSACSEIGGELYTDHFFVLCSICPQLLSRSQPSLSLYYAILRLVVAPLVPGRIGYD